MSAMQDHINIHRISELMFTTYRYLSSYSGYLLLYYSYILFLYYLFP